MKDYFEYQGNTGITGSRDATREAYAMGLITDGENWMEMIASRNQSSHTYDQKIAELIIIQIIKFYFDLFVDFRSKMQTLR